MNYEGTDKFQEMEDESEKEQERTAPAEFIFKHLWEIKHPYYCHNANFYHRGELEEFNSWDDFIREWGDAGLDLNLLFRWDWYLKGHWSEESDILALFFILQRTGIFKPIEVKVIKEDEIKIIEYLRPRFKHLSSLWVPVVKGIKLLRACGHSDEDAYENI